MKIERFFFLHSSNSMLWLTRFMFFLTVAVLFWTQSTAGQHPVVPKLTLAQVEQLISHGVPDSTLSTQIHSRGLVFTPSQAIIDSLHDKGAGPLTLAAIEASLPQQPKINQARTPHGPPPPPDFSPKQIEDLDGSGPPGSNIAGQKEPSSAYWDPDSKSRLYHVGGNISTPVIVHSANAEFSDMARRAKYQGVCIVSVIVDMEGNPQNPRVIRPLGMGLDEQAIKAVKQYKFKPAMMDGRTPVPVMVNLEVSFRLY